MAYTDEVKRAIQIAQALSKEYQNELFAPAHLMMGLLHNEVGLGSWLTVIGQDLGYLREWAEVRMESAPKASRLSPNPPGDERVKATMEVADLVALQLGKGQTDAVCVLTAMLKPNVAFTAEHLRSLPLTQQELLAAAAEDAAIESALTPGVKASSNGTNGAQKEQSPTKGATGSGALYKYCHDKTAQAAEGKLDPIIGRDKEVRMMAEILGRRTKPNVILVGEPGVGKTALIDGFARNIVAGDVPTHLQNALLLELDTGALVAGAAYKGEVEDRLKSILKELKQSEKAILFIDEIHLLLDSRGPLGAGVVNLLKPELSKGEITLIGATTNEEYRKYIETDQAFSRRFEVLRVEEPDIDIAIRMVQHLVPFYEKHHQLQVAPDAVGEAVRLAKRYSRDRRLPDSAVDLLDRTLAAIRMVGELNEASIQQFQDQLTTLTADTDLISLSELRWFHQQLTHKVSPILLNQLAEQPQTEIFESVSDLSAYLTRLLDELKPLTGVKRERVDRQDIAAIISYKTGIPLGKIQSQEREKLLAIEDVLKRRVIGQDHTVKAVSDAILESRSGLTKAGQPIGSFFLLGPTGTGKTELAKSLADFLFNDESFLIRFDMSEFKEEHSAALLYGAPPGYVGYEEGGLLVNKIREKPYSVVLFDEIEKAHPSVFDIFLQILDEGRLHDRLGKEGNFSDAVILFTSNIGSELVAQRFQQGQVPTANELMETMSRYFRPEFLARLTEIVPFAPITEENAIRIFDLHLRSLIDQLTKQGITLELSPEARRHLALSGFTPQYGARPLKGVIRNQLRRPLSRMIIAGDIGKGSTVAVDVRDNELVWTTTALVGV